LPIIEEQVSQFYQISESLECDDEGWTLFVEKVIGNISFKSWRKQKGKGLYMYKTIALLSNFDVNLLLKLQRDLQFMKNYDDYTPALHIVESEDYDDESYSDIIYWRIKIPFIPFLSERDYIFFRNVRKFNDCWVMYDKSIDFESYPKFKNFVRIDDYERVQIIRQTEDNQLQFYLNYLTPMDLKMKIPLKLINWFASSGLTTYVEKLKKCLNDYRRHVDKEDDETSAETQ